MKEAKKVSHEIYANLFHNDLIGITWNLNPSFNFQMGH
jgi:hypothetical protein